MNTLINEAVPTYGFPSVLMSKSSWVRMGNKDRQ